MKRAIRVLWVLAANAFVVFVTLARLRGPLIDRDSRGFQVWLEFILEILVPTLGIILELVQWKFAKWWNVGYLLLAGSLWLIGAIWWHTDSFFGVLLIMSLGFFIIAGLTEIVYRRAH